MPAVVGVPEVIGLFKDVWGDSVIDPFKFMTPVLNDLPMSGDGISPVGADANTDLGGIYHVPTMLSLEGGISTSAPRVQPTQVAGTSATYVLPRAQSTPDAQMQAYNWHGRSNITYEAIARSAGGKLTEGADTDSKRKAVKSASKQVVYGLGKGMAKRVETLALHGTRGLGQIEAIGTVVTGVAYDGATNQFTLDVSIAQDDWAEGIWNMWEGASFDVYTTNVAGQAKSNTSLVNPVLQNLQAGLVLIGINPAAPVGIAANGRILRFLHGENVAAGIQSLAVGRHIYFETGNILSEGPGIDVFARNTGVLFGINGANFSMWAGNPLAAVGNIKMGGLIERLAALINKGVFGQTIRAVVPTQWFMQAANDEASLRRYDVDYRRSAQLSDGMLGGSVSGDGLKAPRQGYGPMVNGFQYLSFLVQGGNELQILGHPFQKGGKILVYPVEELHRIGAQDVQFVRAGDANFATHLANQPGAEIRAYGNFVIYPDVPAHTLVLDGVTY